MSVVCTGEMDWDVDDKMGDFRSIDGVGDNNDNGDSDGFMKVVWALLFRDTNALLKLSNKGTRVSTIAIALRPNFIFLAFMD